MHLETEQIERLHHAELGPAQESLLRAHVRDCPSCARRLGQAAAEEGEIFALLRQLDHPTPSATVGAIVARATASHRIGRRFAAGVALAFAASGALYAVPGSPLPELLHAAREWLSPANPADSPSPEPYASGVAVAPGAQLDVRFAGAQVRGVATVRMVDAQELMVRAIGEPVTFEVDVDRLTVANRGAQADYEILIPWSAPSVRIQIGSELVLRKEMEQIHARIRPDAAGVYRLSMNPTSNP